MHLQGPRHRRVSRDAQQNPNMARSAFQSYTGLQCDLKQFPRNPAHLHEDAVHARYHCCACYGGDELPQPAAGHAAAIQRPPCGCHQPYTTAVTGY